MDRKCSLRTSSCQWVDGDSYLALSNSWYIYSCLPCSLKFVLPFWPLFLTSWFLDTLLFWLILELLYLLLHVSVPKLLFFLCPRNHKYIIPRPDLIFDKGDPVFNRCVCVYMHVHTLTLVQLKTLEFSNVKLDNWNKLTLQKTYIYVSKYFMYFDSAVISLMKYTVSMNCGQIPGRRRFNDDCAGKGWAPSVRALWTCMWCWCEQWWMCFISSATELPLCVEIPEYFLVYWRENPTFWIYQIVSLNTVLSSVAFLNSSILHQEGIHWLKSGSSCKWAEKFYEHYVRDVSCLMFYVVSIYVFCE